MGHGAHPWSHAVGDGKASGASTVWGAAAPGAANIEADLTMPVVPPSELALKVLYVELAVVASAGAIRKDR